MKSTFDSKKSFFELPIVFWTGVIYLVLFVLIILIISNAGEYQACGRADCFNFFVKEFTFPLGFLSTAIPVFAVYAAQHRSSQTLKQIKESERSNNFTIYMKHFEKFNEWLAQDNIKFFVVSDKKLHKSLFTNIRNGHDFIQEETREYINSHVNNIYKAIRLIQSQKVFDDNHPLYLEPQVVKNLETVVFNLKVLSKKFSLNSLTLERDIIVIENWLKQSDVDLSHSNLLLLCNLVKKFFIAFNLILEFCHEYVPRVCQRDGLVSLELDFDKENGVISFALSDFGENGDTIVIHANQIDSSANVYSPNLHIECKTD